MPKFIFVALCALPCLVFAQAPAEPSQSAGMIESTGPNPPRLITSSSLSQHDMGTDVMNVAAPDPFGRVRRSLLMTLGGAAGAAVSAGVVGGGVALLCQRDYCGVTAIIAGVTAGMIGLPLGAWLTGTHFADGDGSLLGTFVGAALGLAVTLPLWAEPNLHGYGLVGANIAATLVGAVLMYELTSHPSAAAARTMKVTGVSFVPSATQDRSGARIPVIALAARFH